MGGSFVKPMLELFMLTVLLIVARDPAFDVSVQTLPQLASADGPAAPAATGRARIAGLLRADGTVLWKEQPLPRELLAGRIATETTAQDTVALVVETRDGAGPLEAFLQTQLDCCRLGVWDRVRVLYRPAVPGPARGPTAEPRSPKP
jgi:hypothetical protein